MPRPAVEGSPFCRFSVRVPLFNLHGGTSVGFEAAREMKGFFWVNLLGYLDKSPR